MHSEKSPVRSNQPTERGRQRELGDKKPRKKNSFSPSSSSSSSSSSSQNPSRHRTNPRPHRRKKKDKETTALKRPYSSGPEGGSSGSVSDVHRVARQGDVDALAQLIARGFDVNTKVFGCSPLHWVTPQPFPHISAKFSS